MYLLLFIIVVLVAYMLYKYMTPGEGEIVPATPTATTPEELGT